MLYTLGIEKKFVVIKNLFLLFHIVSLFWFLPPFKLLNNIIVVNNYSSLFEIKKNTLYDDYDILLIILTKILGKSKISSLAYLWVFSIGQNLEEIEVI